MRWPRRRPTAEHWFEQHAGAFAGLDAGSLDGQEAHRRRVEATWGLIACGPDAIPYAQRMLASSDADIREDGAGVLGELGRDPAVVSAVIDALARETDDQARDALVQALGVLGDKRAIPPLAALIRSDETDGDTRFTAAQSLGRVVRRRFDREADPVGAAVRWLDAHDA